MIVGFCFSYILLSSTILSKLFAASALHREGTLVIPIISWKKRKKKRGPAGVAEHA